MRYIIILFSVFFMPANSHAKIMALPLQELVKQSDIICIAYKVSAEKVSDTESSSVLIRNIMKSRRFLKGAADSIIIHTKERRREDNLVIPDKGDMILFLKSNTDGTYRTINGIQGLWPLDDNEPLGMGLGTSLRQIEDEIMKQK